MKSEPSTFSIDDLAKRPNQSEPWDGVRNYQARNFMRTMQLNDLAFFYHSSCEVPGIAGIVKITKTAQPDKTQFDLKSDYYDPKATPENPRWFCVEVKLVKKFDHIITLETLRKQATLKDMRLLQRGSRLSVMPVTSNEWSIIDKLIK